LYFIIFVEDNFLCLKYINKMKLFYVHRLAQLYSILLLVANSRRTIKYYIVVPSGVHT